LLIGLPLAIIFVAMVRQVFTNHTGGLSQAGVIFLATLVFTFGMMQVSNYIHWQARWVKDRSVMEHLRLIGPGDVSVFWVDDQHPAGAGRAYPYTYYDWSGMFKKIWGDEAHFGSPISDRPSRKDNLDRFVLSSRLMSELDPEGCQAVMTIRQGERDHEDIGLVGRYYYYKFLKGEEALRSFLLEVSEVQIEPIDAPEAVHCRR
jgi:hypothetical protein